MHALLAPFTAALSLLLASAAPSRQDDPDAVKLAAELVARHVPPKATRRIVYEGSWSQEAHLAKPHDTRVLQTRLTLLDDGAKRARLDRETWRALAPDRVEVET